MIESFPDGDLDSSILAAVVVGLITERSPGRNRSDARKPIRLVQCHIQSVMQSTITAVVDFQYHPPRHYLGDPRRPLETVRIGIMKVDRLLDRNIGGDNSGRLKPRNLLKICVPVIRIVNTRSLGLGGVQGITEGLRRTKLVILGQRLI